MISLLRCSFLLAACCVAGCTAKDSPPPADSAASASASVAPDANGGTVTFDAVPPLRVGMSADEARSALGLPSQSTAKNSESCHYLDTKGASHAFVMLANDTVVRFDIRDRSLATSVGAKVGDSEVRIRALYRDQVTEQPHKYVSGGRYLVVTTPSDTALRLVFETDGTTVTSFRVGRRPAVEFVEGCG